MNINDAAHAKAHLIVDLLNDFIQTFPESTRAERVEVHSRLMLMDLSDLELLHSQLPIK